MADLSKELNKELSKDFAYCEDALGRAENAIGNLPSAQPEKRTEERAETHACDLIDRQAAIDAVEESRRLNHHQDGKEACAHEYEHRHFLKILRDLPSAQPEIIRCKDCLMHGVCRFEQGLGLDGYCSQAERRTDE